MSSGEVRSGLKAKPHRPKNISGAKNHRSLDDILELANVSRPMIGLAQLQRILADVADLLSSLFGIALHEVFDQHRNVFFSVPEGWHMNRENVQPVEKVGAKCP